MSMDDLKEKLLAAINKENLLETINEFNHLYRYSGKEEGERAAKYIESKLQEYGVDYETIIYDGFFSIPVFAELKVKNRFYELVGDVYSKEAYHLTGELVYDQLSEASSPLTELEEEQRMARFKDKIVLTWRGVAVRWQLLPDRPVRLVHLLYFISAKQGDIIAIIQI